jgi:hypothetical protein
VYGRTDRYECEEIRNERQSKQLDHEQGSEETGGENDVDARLMGLLMNSIQERILIQLQLAIILRKRFL